MKQVLVVGLGMFGSSVARTLAERNVEVLCVDKDPDLVQTASEWAAEALVFDATEEERLREVFPDRRDACVCAIGADSRDASIVCTVLLRQLGAKRVISRAKDPLHERILRLVGAHEVVNPERAFGERLAARLMFDGVIAQFPLGRDLTITELAVPSRFVGRSLAELELPKRFGVYVVAVRRAAGEEGEVRLPDPSVPFEEEDIILLAARPENVAKMLEKL